MIGFYNTHAQEAWLTEEFRIRRSPKRTGRLEQGTRYTTRQNADEEWSYRRATLTLSTTSRTSSTGTSPGAPPVSILALPSVSFNRLNVPCYNQCARGE